MTGSEEGKADEREVPNGDGVPLLKVLGAPALAVNVGVTVELRQVVVASLPMELALGDPMQFSKNAGGIEPKCRLFALKLAQPVGDFRHGPELSAVDYAVSAGALRLLRR